MRRRVDLAYVLSRLSLRLVSTIVVASLLLCCVIALFAGCSSNASTTPNSLTFLLESNPTNLDPRFATDAASQHIDGLLFSSLLERDAQMTLHGDLAESWETSDPLTWIFHLRKDVNFSDGRPVTSADVKGHVGKRADFENILN